MNAGCSAIGRTSTATTSRTLSQSGLRRVFAGGSAARYFGVPVSDPRHPDIWGIVQHGVVYTGGTGKIAEHGGADPDDRDVPTLVFAPGVARPGVYDQQLETTSVAPTVMRLLGVNPYALQAVRIQSTPVLPGVR